MILEMWISPTGSSVLIIVSMSSLSLFPAGWCESNHYPLTAPKVDLTLQFNSLIKHKKVDHGSKGNWQESFACWMYDVQYFMANLRNHSTNHYWPAFVSDQNTLYLRLNCDGVSITTPDFENFFLLLQMGARIQYSSTQLVSLVRFWVRDGYRNSRPPSDQVLLDKWLKT